MENKRLQPISIIILALSIVFGSIWIGHSLEKSFQLQNSIITSADSKILNISQVAEYLNMSVEEVQGIISTEKIRLEGSGTFTGMMFPYFTVDNKKYFNKNEIDVWLKEVSLNHRQYNTAEGWVQ